MINYIRLNSGNLYAYNEKELLLYIKMIYGNHQN